MKDKDYPGRVRGRSVFGEVAKGLGFISEHKATHGRYEQFLFLINNKYYSLKVK